MIIIASIAFLEQKYTEDEICRKMLAYDVSAKVDKVTVLAEVAPGLRTRSVIMKFASHLLRGSRRSGGQKQPI
jgi:hypothetical protein